MASPPQVNAPTLKVPLKHPPKKSHRGPTMFLCTFHVLAPQTIVKSEYCPDFRRLWRVVRIVKFNRVNWTHWKKNTVTLRLLRPLQLSLPINPLPEQPHSFPLSSQWCILLLPSSKTSSYKGQSHLRDLQCTQGNEITKPSSHRNEHLKQ